LNEEKTKEAMQQVLQESKIGTMATVRNNRPHSRYMTFFHRDFTLYTPTHQGTDKTEEVEKNPYTHIIIGYEGEGFGDEYLEYEGKVNFHDSEELKKELWNEDLKTYFDGPEDPNYTLLEIEPIRISLMNKQGSPPKEMTWE